MSKSKTATTGPAKKAPPVRSSAAVARAVVLLAVLLAGASAMGYTYGLRNAPLGIPLPPKPAPVVQTAGIEMKDSSVVTRRISTKILDLLAPQPDGASPLMLLLPSDRGDFAMKFPFGSQYVNLPDDVYNKTHTDSQVTFKYGQPLFLGNAMFIPREDAESYSAAAQRLLKEEVRNGAQAVSSSELLPEPGTPFAQFAYVHKGPEGDQEFRSIYVGPYGSYLLVLDFMAKAKYQEQALALANKIVASFHSNFPQAERLRPQDTVSAVPAK